MKAQKCFFIFKFERNNEYVHIKNNSKYYECDIFNQMKQKNGFLIAIYIDQ